MAIDFGLFTLRPSFHQLVFTFTTLEKRELYLESQPLTGDPWNASDIDYFAIN